MEGGMPLWYISNDPVSICPSHAGVALQWLNRSTLFLGQWLTPYPKVLLSGPLSKPWS